MTAAAIAIASVGIVGLGAAFLRDQRQEKSRRHDLLAGCRGALDGEVLQHDHAGYPSLIGSYAGHRAELRLVVDMIQLRKLPVLWLQATLHRPVAIGGELSLKSSNMAAAEHWAARLADPALEFFADDRAKELLLTPKGVRLTWRVAETERGHYLTTRLARFERAEIDRAGAQALLARAADLAELGEGAA